MSNRLSLILITLLFTLILGCNTSNKVSHKKEFHVGNIFVDKQEDQVVVHYDLLCNKPGTDFKVNLFMEVDKGGYYHINGHNTSGALGNNISPGTQKQIVWNISRDFPFGIETDNVKFVVQAIPEKG